MLAPPQPQPRPFSVAEFTRLTAANILPDSDNLELVRDTIFRQAAQSPARTAYITRLLKTLVSLLGDLATLRCQAPLNLSPDSQPEPDFALVRNRPDDYLSAHPSAADVLLLIEISDSSLDYDRRIKLPLHAEAGIEHYWIFNLGVRVACRRQYRILETYSQLLALGCESTYRNQQNLTPEQAIALPNFPTLTLPLAPYFPRPAAPLN